MKLTMQLDNIQDRKFPPVGRCVYCGSSGGVDGLRDEHIIAFSLGGNALLPEASCSDCEKITSYLDGYLAREVFGHFRIHAEVQTRRPRKRPTQLPINVIYQDRTEQPIVAIPDHPFAIVMPAFGLPGVLRDLPPSEVFQDAKLFHWYHAPDSLVDALGLEVGESAKVRMTGNLNAGTFARALAKIAHGLAVAYHGIDGFHALLPDFIRGLYPYGPYLIGGRNDDPPPPSKESLHEYALLGWPHGDQTFLVLVLRLFAIYGTPGRGMPIYYIVVGTEKN